MEIARNFNPGWDMCGIIGYTGGGNAAEIIYEGLIDLEYRGYDSAGMAVIENGKCKTVKSCGRVNKLSASLGFLRGGTGIGHTRWATHGKPSNANAHPHSCGKVTIVHNGIIENYAELKEKLSAEGEIFVSETDSEVIAHLINGYFGGDLTEAVEKCVGMLKGSYALLAICDGWEGIVAAKNRSPVILGYGENCNYCASDLPALAGKCKRVCVMEDGDIAVITPSGITIRNGGRETERPAVKNPAEPAALALGGFPHYMVKELWEAPAAVKNTLSAFCDCRSEISAAVKGAQRVVLTGCGTAYHAALAGKRYFEEFTGLPCEADYAGELRYKTPRRAEKTLLVAITQSGETADTVETARLYYNTPGCTVLAVTNSPYSAITRTAHAVVPVVAGTEVSVAATKSYSGQIAALYLLALCAAGDVGFGQGAEKLSSVPGLILKTLEKIDIYAVAEMCASSRGVYFMGRDMDYAVALEGSLKLKEVSYIPGSGYPASELKHGPLALIDEKTLSVFIITDGDLAVKASGGVEQVLARRGKVAVITNLDSVKKRFAGRAEIISLPPCDKYLSPMLSAAALQLLAYRTAVISGRDPDKPRNLAKSVTVE